MRRRYRLSSMRELQITHRDNRSEISSLKRKLDAALHGNHPSGWWWRRRRRRRTPVRRPGGDGPGRRSRRRWGLWRAGLRQTVVPGRPPRRRLLALVAVHRPAPFTVAVSPPTQAAGVHPPALLTVPGRHAMDEAVRRDHVAGTTKAPGRMIRAGGRDERRVGTDPRSSGFSRWSARAAAAARTRTAASPKRTAAPRRRHTPGSGTHG
jgi:hypothetical protein